MIIVTGATGKLGSAITERLLKKLPAGQIGVSVRDPAKASDLQARGVRVRSADFDDPASLRLAFADAAQVLIISSNSSGERVVEHHRNAIEAACSVGARRVLYTSHMGCNPASAFQPMVDHAATEEILKACGAAFTSLRNGFYADSGRLLLGQGLETGTVAAPNDGPVSWTAHADLADAAVIALTDEHRLAGVTPPLTASTALDLSAIVAIASELTGRPITRTTVPDEPWRAGLVSHGVPAARADLLVGLFRASRNGEFAAVDPTLERLLGRPLLTMRDALGAIPRAAR